MKRVAVESEAIKSIGYDAGAKTLEVEFITGRVYDYFGVPPEVYRALLEAESLGAFFNRDIRDAYRFREAGLAGRRGGA